MTSCLCAEKVHWSWIEIALSSLAFYFLFGQSAHDNQVSVNRLKLKDALSVKIVLSSSSSFCYFSRTEFVIALSPLSIPYERPALISGDYGRSCTKSYSLFIIKSISAAQSAKICSINPTAHINDWQKDYCRDWSNNVKRLELRYFDWPIPTSLHQVY